MAEGNTTYDIQFEVDNSVAYGLVKEELDYIDTLILYGYDLQYTILAMHEQVYVTIAEATTTPDGIININPEYEIIPPNNPLDITIDVPVWYLASIGMTLPQLAQNQNWQGGLSDSGLQVNSIDQSAFSATMVIHCTTTKWVNVKDIILKDEDGQILLAGTGLVALLPKILTILAILGIVSGVVILTIRLTGTVNRTVEYAAKKEDDAAAIIENHPEWTNDEITKFLYAWDKTNQIVVPNPTGIDFSGIIKYAAIGIAGVAAIVILPKIIPSKSSSKSLARGQ